MKKLHLFTFSILFVTKALHAQIPTLTAANINPALNDSFLNVTCQVGGVTIPGPAGANQTWNFSTLVDSAISDSVYVSSVVYATSGTNYSSFSAAASGLGITSFASSNYALIDPSTTVTTYYNESATKATNTAVYYDASDYILYKVPLVTLEFPFTYSDTFSSSYSGYIALSATGPTPKSQSGKVQVTADAYGTLILPPTPPSSSPSNYSGVLRVHSFQLLIDSVGLFGVPYAVDTLDTYQWFLPGYHSPLLTILTEHSIIANQTTITYERKQLANHEAVPSVGLDASLRIFPNPASNVVNVVFDNNTGSAARVSLVDMLGREVAVMADGMPVGQDHVSYNISSFAKGTYLVRIESAGQSATRTIDIQ